ncbi:hypothetical protein PN294_13410 [Romboutsia sp. 1001216sp1]|uniref:hypothetical protein n=1 Tax=unclassified Romboutsia TaxID=2626894 RepID=UPI0018A0990B|nr:MULTISPECIES: hypothetical protein [unclassified Romboutsia]MDB8803181.1 hypothetical protein [Romboutsia sp. 1001216sp1]MDB8814540.1 hypothetical protein [Romboutsia sp. 1001216sp1]
MKRKRTFYLSDDDVKYIEDYKEEHNLPSKNIAFSEILNEHKVKSELPMQTMYEFIAKKVSEELESTLKDAITNTLKPQLNSLKFATNSTNKDTQILLELLNGIYYKESYGAIPTIDSLPTMAYEMSKEYVEGKIKNKHYKNSNTLD